MLEKQGIRMNFFNKSVITKVIFISVIFIIISMSILTFLVTKNVFEITKENSETEISKELGLIADTISTFNKVAKNNANTTASIFLNMLKDIRIDKSQNIKVGEFQTPVLYQDNKILNLNFDIVDRFTEITSGSVATIFVKKDNDFIRVSTSLKKEDGSRAIGTKLDTNHPGYKKVLEGQNYLGKATLFGKDYMTKYMPIIRNGEIIAIAFIGFDINRDLMDLIDTINSKVVGDTGYYYVLNSNEKSSKYGHFIAHPTLQHKSALELNADGIYFIKDILKTKNGKFLYMWQGHKKLVIYQNFEEWNWLLVAGVNYDEFFKGANRVMYIIINKIWVVFFF